MCLPHTHDSSDCKGCNIPPDQQAQPHRQASLTLSSPQGSDYLIRGAEAKREKEKEREREREREREKEGIEVRCLSISQKIVTRKGLFERTSGTYSVVGDYARASPILHDAFSSPATELEQRYHICRWSYPRDCFVQSRQDSSHVVSFP